MARRKSHQTISRAQVERDLAAQHLPYRDMSSRSRYMPRPEVNGVPAEQLTSPDGIVEAVRRVAVGAVVALDHIGDVPTSTFMQEGAFIERRFLGRGRARYVAQTPTRLEATPITDRVAIGSDGQLYVTKGGTAKLVERPEDLLVLHGNEGTLRDIPNYGERVVDFYTGAVNRLVEQAMHDLSPPQ